MYTLSLHDALPIYRSGSGRERARVGPVAPHREGGTVTIQGGIGMDRHMVRDRKGGFDRKGAAIGQQEVPADDGRIGESCCPGRLIEGEIVVSNPARLALGPQAVECHRSASRGENTVAVRKIAAVRQVARSA